MTNNPILVTGCARSGTSLVAGIVHACGAFGGKLAGPNRHNRRGMFENNAIRQNILKPFLRSLGYDPMGQNPLPDIGVVAHAALERRGGGRRFDQLRESVLRVMRSEGYVDGPWFYKGAKMCLTWPIWNLAFPDARWIIVRRDSTKIAESCLRTGFMRAHKALDGWLGWVAVHEERFAEMMESCPHAIEVSTDEIVAGNLGHIESVIKLCGLDWDAAAVGDFIDPTLFHSKEPVGAKTS